MSSQQNCNIIFGAIKNYLGLDNQIEVIKVEFEEGWIYVYPDRIEGHITLDGWGISWFTLRGNVIRWGETDMWSDRKLLPDWNVSSEFFSEFAERNFPDEVLEVFRDGILELQCFLIEIN